MVAQPQRMTSVYGINSLQGMLCSGLIVNVWFQIRVKASDQKKVSEKTAEATVTVHVKRDQYVPEFTMPSTNFDINIGHQVNGDAIGVARVNDRDKTVSVLFNQSVAVILLIQQ